MSRIKDYGLMAQLRIAEIINEEQYQKALVFVDGIYYSLVSEPEIRQTTADKGKSWIYANDRATEWNRADIDEAIEIINSLVSEPIEDGWISVEDRLPREDEYSQLAYVIDRTHRRIPITGRFAGDKWQVTTWVGKDVILLPLEMVTHWRDTKWNEPLPEPQEYDPHEVAQEIKEPYNDK